MMYLNLYLINCNATKIRKILNNVYSTKYKQYLYYVYIFTTVLNEIFFVENKPL